MSDNLLDRLQDELANLTGELDSTKNALDSIEQETTAASSEASDAYNAASEAESHADQATSEINELKEALDDIFERLELMGKLIDELREQLPDDDQPVTEAASGLEADILRYKAVVMKLAKAGLTLPMIAKKLNIGEFLVSCILERAQNAA